MSDKYPEKLIDPKNLDTLRAAALGASQRVRGDRTALRFRRGAAPRPGDTFLFHQTAEPPVQWAILGTDPSAKDRLLAVPVDDYPQVGSHDVELYVDDPLRVANARCRLGVSLPTSSFDPNLRAGALETEALAEVQQKHRAIEEGLVQASLSDELVDDDPDYRRWTSELRRMIERLERTVRERPPDAEEAGRPTTPDPGPSSPLGLSSPPTFGSRRWMAPMALAASLVMAVGLWSQNERNQQERREWQATLERQEAEKAALADAKGELEGRLDASGDALGALREQVESLGRDARAQRKMVARLESETLSQRDRIQNLKSSLEATARPVGPLAAVTLNDRGRSAMSVVRLTESTESVLLQLEPADPEIYPDYELRVIEESTHDVVITSRALAWHRQYLGIVLPVALFREAESETFNLELWATVDGALRRIDTGYQLRIER